MKKIEATGRVDPLDPSSWYKVLWVVYGSPFEPTFKTVSLNCVGAPTIWGYSTYSNSPKFRTLGQDLTEWISRNYYDGLSPTFFDDQNLALDYLKRLTTPKCDPCSKR